MSAGALVSAIIPTLGTNSDRLLRAIEAVRAQTYDGPVDIIVVLNTSDPMPWADHLDGVEVLRPGLNLGWAGGLRHGRAAAQGTQLWLVQDDMRASPTCLATLADALAADPTLAAVSPTVIAPDGLVPAGSCGGVLTTDGPVEMDHWYPREAMEPHGLSAALALDYVASRGILTHSADWDAVGGMYPGFYPVQWADVDYCASLRHAGRRFTFVPTALVEHDANGSTPSPFAHFLSERNRRLFGLRHRAEGWRSPALDADHELISLTAHAAAGLAKDLGGAYSEAMVKAVELGARFEEIHAEAAAAHARAETLAAELATARRTLRRAQRTTDSLRSKLATSRRRVRALESSHSWRLTAPLRRISRLLGR